MAIFRCVWCFTFYSWRNLLRCVLLPLLHVVILCSFSFVFFVVVFSLVSWFLCAHKNQETNEARSQFASGRSCVRPPRLRFSVVFLDPTENAELVPKFHVALHASHAALQILTYQHFALRYPSSLRIKIRCNTARLKPRGFDTKTYWLTVDRNVTLDWTTLFLGDINTGTWPSRLEESHIFLTPFISNQNYSDSIS
jgi:hypothetical protein